MKDPESIAGVVFSPDRSQVLLILRRDVPLWVLPGGSVDPGETAEQAVVREILEETGLTVKIDRLIGRYYPINRLAKRTIVYECSLIAGTLKTTEETRGAEFFPLSALPPQPPPYPEWIQEAYSLKLPITRDLTSVNYRTLFKYLLFHPILVFRFLFARAGLSINTKG